MRWSWGIAVVAAVAVGSFMLGGSVARDPQGPFGQNVAAWVQALGALLSVWVVVWVLHLQTRSAAQSRARRESELRIAAAAFAEQIGEVIRELGYVRLPRTDQDANAGKWEGEGGRVRSPPLQAIAHHLGTFPVHDLGDPDMMLWMMAAHGDVLQALEILDSAEAKLGRKTIISRNIEGMQGLSAHMDDLVSKMRQRATERRHH